MHINFSIDGEEIVSSEQRRSFSAVLRAVADTLASGTGTVTVEGFRPAPPEPIAHGGPIGPSGVLVPAKSEPPSDPYVEKPKPPKPAKAKPAAEPKVADSKDPSQAALPLAAPASAPPAVPDPDALRAIVNKYTNRFGLAKLRETVTAFGVKKLLELTDVQKSEWASARNAELAVPVVEEN